MSANPNHSKKRPMRLTERELAMVDQAIKERACGEGIPLNEAISRAKQRTQAWLNTPQSEKSMA